MDLLKSFFVPLLICMVPLLLLIGLVYRRRFRRSVAIVISASFLSVFTGLFTPILATFLAADIMVSWFPDTDEPKCVTGAAIFLPIGLVFTLLTLLLGIYLIIMHYYRTHRNLKKGE